ncbi:poly(ADP-ribose) glycohydrolase isoform X1 [Misgurnus anguillicaudatus]|uniref:poly(ADP-ribose) glycohydrolase isoform X1 n=1 Tax=Misgurnus anguillicaudatus TaxID=75329 RepID=UPI003CCFA330
MSDCEPLSKRQRVMKSDPSQSDQCHSLHTGRQIQMRNSKGKRAQKSLDHWLVKKPNVTQTDPQPEHEEPEESRERSDDLHRTESRATESPRTSQLEPASDPGRAAAADLLSAEDAQIKTNTITDFFTKTSMKYSCRKARAPVLAGQTVSSDVTWLGVPLGELQRAPACSNPLPRLKATDTHTVMIRTDLLHPGKVPVPYPSLDKTSDCWDAAHVKMPCSKHNLFPSGHSTQTLESRWVLINKALRRPFSSSEDVKDAILKYNAAQAKGWDFTALNIYCQGLQKAECEQMFRDLIPAMVELALRLDSLCTQPIPLLQSQQCRSVTMSQEQVSCLLANAFFCTFPRRSSRRTEFSNYPDINFNRLFEGSSQKKLEKLKTVLWYFRRITQHRPTGVVTYMRRCLQSFPSWWSSEQTFSKLHISCDETIEEHGYGLLQVDFANRFVGGGVIGSGLVQEEIRFLINPELIVARLFTEALDDNECLIITGTEQFSRYSGYSDTFKWDGNHDDQTPRDEWHRRYTEIVAIDALHYRNFLQQFHPDNMTRELNKAYCGFARPEVKTKHLSAVATGNWGCGAFGGDTRLKAVLQMMAAAEARRDLIYFTFGDAELLRDIHNIHTLITHKQITVGSMFGVLQKYYERVCSTASNRKLQESLYCFLSEHL